MEAETVAKVISTQIEKESESCSKLDVICPKCGEHLFQEFDCMSKKVVLKVMCKCEVAQMKEIERHKEVEEKQRKLEKIITNSLMDSKFQDSTFENWDFEKGTKKMYDLGRRYSENFKKCKAEGLGLLIYGDPGNGKTYVSSCIANELLNSLTPVICVSINGLLSRIQETYNRWGREAESDVIRGLCNADLLIIDDLGTEKKTDWSRSMIYNVIDSRYRSNLPLIITSNLKINPKKTNGILSELYDRRTEDRILEMCTPIENTQKSIRVDSAKTKTDMLRSILYA